MGRSGCRDGMGSDLGFGALGALVMTNAKKPMRLDLKSAQCNGIPCYGNGVFELAAHRAGALQAQQQTTAAPSVYT